MTTIILTIIGILLAAAAALMVVFYGGDAFSSGTLGADANMIQNAGTNVASATQMYRAEKGGYPTDLTQLLDGTGISGAFLDSIPAVPAPATVESAIGTDRKFLVNAVPTAICTRINKNLKVGTQPATVALATAKMSCTTTGVFVARL